MSAVKGVAKDYKTFVDEFGAFQDTIVEKDNLAARVKVLQGEVPWELDAKELEQIRDELEHIRGETKNISDDAETLQKEIIRIRDSTTSQATRDKMQGYLDPSIRFVGVDAAIKEIDDTYDEIKEEQRKTNKLISAVLTKTAERKIKDRKEYDKLLPLLYPEYAKASAQQKKEIEAEFERLKDRKFYREKFALEAENKKKEEKVAKKINARKKAEKKGNITKYAELDPDDLLDGEHYGVPFDLGKQQKYFAEMERENKEAAKKLAEAPTDSYESSAIDAAKAITRSLKSASKVKNLTYLGIGKSAGRRRRRYRIGGAIVEGGAAVGASVSDIVGLPRQNPITLEVGQLAPATEIKLDKAEADSQLAGEPAEPALQAFGGKKKASQKGTIRLFEPDASTASARPRGLPAALGPWTAHLKQFRAAHPGLSLRECMQEAKKTYKK